MPIYEYHCAKCGEFEVTQRITEEPLKRCPKCRSKVRKLISNTSFQLKGSGWYATDYARKDSGGAKKEKGESASESKTGSKSETKTESKSPSESGKSGKAENARAA